MKPFLILILFLSFTFNAFGQNLADSGFTHKAETANQKVNGLKEGKWVEYFKFKKGVKIETKNKYTPLYALTVYKAGKPCGMARDYYKSGKLWSETPYLNGMVSGVRKVYDENGALLLADTIINGKENGIIKTYYPNGKLDMECPFTNDQFNTLMKISFDNNGIHLFQSKEFRFPVNYCLNGTPKGVFKTYNESGK